MHLRLSRQSVALTRIDVLVCLVVIGILSGLAFPALARARGRAARSGCICRLKQIGLAFRMYANDNGDKFPWAIPGPTGTLAYALSPEVFRHFAVASNELNTPKILTCPTDKSRSKTTDWATFSNTNLSYFLAPDAAEGKPCRPFSGDRNILGGILSNGFLLTIYSTSTVSFSKEMHNRAGNVGLADGSAQQLTSQGFGSLVANALMPDNGSDQLTSIQLVLP